MTDIATLFKEPNSNPCLLQFH